MSIAIDLCQWASLVIMVYVTEHSFISTYVGELDAVAGVQPYNLAIHNGQWLGGYHLCMVASNDFNLCPCRYWCAVWSGQRNNTF